jgi:hypothetical protein
MEFAKTTEGKPAMPANTPAVFVRPGSQIDIRV